MVFLAQNSEAVGLSTASFFCKEIYRDMIKNKWPLL